MSSKWERTFDISVPLETVWEAFTDPAYREKLFAPPAGAQTSPQREGRELEMLEVEPMRRLRWRQDMPHVPERAEFTVVFEESERGSRIKVTRAGFGDGEVAKIFADSNGLGWEHGFMDLVLALETEQIVKRHYDGVSKSSMGVLYTETDWGIEVRDVTPGLFGAEVGLEPGDRLVRIAGAPIFARSDVWLVNSLFDEGAELEVEFVRDRELRKGQGKLSARADHAVGE